jgi:hypothetical protein
MKRTFIVLAILLILGIAIAYAQQPGITGGPYGGYCPYCGRWMGPGMMGPGYGGYGMGPGMMGGYGGYGMGPGMMGPGYGPQYPQQYQQYQQYPQPQKPLAEKDAKEIAENYLRNMRNPNLKVGKMKDAGSAFEADIVTKDNSLVDKVLIDKATGWMHSAY